MDLLDFFQQITKLKERENEQQMWELWLSTFPFMKMGFIKDVPFDEFMAPTKQKEIISNGQSQETAHGYYADQVFL